MAIVNTLTLLALGLAFALFGTSCGVHQPVVLQDERSKEEQKPDQPGAAPVFLEGEILSLTGKIDLRDLRDKPLILMFAGFACNTCAEEIAEFRGVLNDPNQAPSKVQMVSVVVGEDRETAEWWKEMREVPWTVAYDESLQHFRKWCGNSPTPCTFIQVPEKGIVLKHVGKVSVEEAKKHTGDWE